MKEFKSKVGYEILIPVLILLIGVMSGPFLTDAPLGAQITLVSITIPILIFVLHMFYSTTYKINEKKELVIQCGWLFRSVVEIEKIKSIHQTRNPIASPAPSMDRIELKYGKWESVIVSPQDKSGFIKELLRINSKIKSSTE